MNISLVFNIFLQNHFSYVIFHRLNISIGCLQFVTTMKKALMILLIALSIPKFLEEALLASWIYQMSKAFSI